MTTQAGNLDQVRSALQGITGQDVSAAVVPEFKQWWYMLIVRANHQHDAVDSMRRHGLRSFWPTYECLVTTRRQSAGRPVRRLVRTGVVPYIFSPADFDVVEKLETIIGVIDVVRSDAGRPLLVPDPDVEKIRRIAIGLNESVPPEVDPNHKYKVGDVVAFRGEQRDWPPSTVIRLVQGGRIVVEVALMGRKVPVTVLPFQIEPT